VALAREGGNQSPDSVGLEATEYRRMESCYGVTQTKWVKFGTDDKLERGILKGRTSKNRVRKLS